MKNKEKEKEKRKEKGGRRGKSEEGRKGYLFIYF